VAVIERKPFLLRLDPMTMAALRAWADDDLRSLNGQIEFLLRRALREAGRLPAAGRSGDGAEAAFGSAAAPADNSVKRDDGAHVPALQTRSGRR
jgi:hypothetical protein